MKNGLRLKKLTQTALMAALCFVSFTYLQIKIPVPGGDATSLHIGNAFCVLASLLLGLITGLIAHKYAKINESNDKKYILKWSIIAAIGGLAFNVIADPVVGFFYKQYVLGQPQDAAMILAKLSAATTFINAIVSVVVVTILYNAIRPVLKKADLLLPV